MYVKNIQDLVRGELHRFILELVEYALHTADPYNAVLKSFKVDNNVLVIHDLKLEVNGDIHVVGFGKASKRMAEAVYSVLGDRIKGGVVITPSEEGRIGNIVLTRGDHPIPRETH